MIYRDIRYMDPSLILINQTEVGIDTIENNQKLTKFT